MKAILGVMVTSTILFLIARNVEMTILHDAEAQIIAQSGCCKEWDSSRRQWQVLVGYNYEDCDYENDRRDGDRVESESGDIWWDTYC